MPNASILMPGGRGSDCDCGGDGERGGGDYKLRVEGRYPGGGGESVAMVCLVMD